MKRKTKNVLEELIAKQKQKQFEKKLKEKVDRESWIKWANQKDYTEVIQEKINKGEI